MIQNNLEDMFTIEQVANKWNMSPGFIRKEINAGNIKPNKLGRSIRISAYELKLYQDKTKRGW